MIDYVFDFICAPAFWYILNQSFLLLSRPCFGGDRSFFLTTVFYFLISTSIVLAGVDSAVSPDSLNRCKNLELDLSFKMVRTFFAPSSSLISFNFLVLRLYKIVAVSTSWFGRGTLTFRWFSYAALFNYACYSLMSVMNTVGHSLIWIVLFLITFSYFGSYLIRFIVDFFSIEAALSLSSLKESMKAFGGMAVRQD